MFARFAPGEEFRPGFPMYIRFVREVNGVRPDTFGAPKTEEDSPRKGYTTEQYPNARIIHGPENDPGVRVIADTVETAVAFQAAAAALGIHLAGPTPEPANAPTPSVAEVSRLLATMQNARRAYTAMDGAQGLDTVRAEAWRVLSDAEAEFIKLFPFPLR